MIDYELFDETYGEFGKEMIHEIIDIYLSEYEGRFREFRKNMAENDMQALGKNAHSLKGATAVFYDDVVVDLARKLEFKGKDNDSTGITELVDDLQKETYRLAADLVKLKEKYKD